MKPSGARVTGTTMERQAEIIVETWMKEHCPFSRNGHTELSAVGENAWIGWAIIYSDPRILDSKIRNEPKEKFELTRINECHSDLTWAVSVNINSRCAGAAPL